jgi:hypothetical protein
MSRAALAVTLALAGRAPAAADCDVQARRDATLDVAGASVILVDARAGSLRIEGRPGTGKVTVRGTACASDRELLDRIQLVSELRGRTAHVEAVMPEHEGWGGRRAYAFLDLVIEVPDGVPLDVRDTSGDATIESVAALRVTDSSGGLVLRHVGGDLSVRDSSGDLEIADVEGTVRVRDTSGEITIRDVGAVVIESDGSGGIAISNVRGDVAIHDDGSGGIEVDDVGADFTVDDDGSGGIRHAGVKGRVRIPGR